MENWEGTQKIIRKKIAKGTASSPNRNVTSNDHRLVLFITHLNEISGLSREPGQPATAAAAGSRSEISPFVP